MARDGLGSFHVKIFLMVRNGLGGFQMAKWPESLEMVWESKWLEMVWEASRGFKELL